MSTNQPIINELPDVPEIGLHDLFFDKYGFIRKIPKAAPKVTDCMFCGTPGPDICERCGEIADEAGKRYE